MRCEDGDDAGDGGDGDDDGGPKPPSTYRLLPLPEGATTCSPVGITDAGVVAGRCFGQTFGTYAVLWHDDAIEVLKGVARVTQSDGTVAEYTVSTTDPGSVSADGTHLAATVRYLQSGTLRVGVGLWQGDGWEILPLPPEATGVTAPRGVNTYGEVAATARIGTVNHTAILRASGSDYLKNPEGTSLCNGWSINAGGDVVAFCMRSSTSVIDGYVWTDGEPAVLATPASRGTMVTPYKITDSGVIVGGDGVHGLVWHASEPSAYTIVTPLGAVRDVNEDGALVGWQSRDGVDALAHDAIWVRDAESEPQWLLDEDDQVAASLRTQALAINASGAVAGTLTTASNAILPFLAE